MRREEFIYNYLLKYNEYEKDFKGKDAVRFWKESDKKNGTSGLIFMVLRNALVHNTLETISKIENIGSFTEVINALNKCKLNSEDQKKYMSILLENDKVKSDLESKKFKLINSSREDVFKLFQRKDDHLYSTIFFSHTNLLFDTSVSTYNQEKECKELFNGYYIEAELYEDKYILKFFKDDETVIKHQISIYVEKNFSPQRLYQSIDFIDIAIINYGKVPNTQIKFDIKEINKLGNNKIKELFNRYACDSTIRDTARRIKNCFAQMNNFLHIIGMQNDV